MKNKMKIFLVLVVAIISMTVVSCDEPEYKTEYKQVAYMIVEKESHTELNWATELIFDVKTTKVVYNLVLQRNGYTKVKEVNSQTYYSYRIGDIYYMYEYVNVKNPKYKEK